ncbi:MAG: CBS domain-containing protein [Thermoplasmata archaeon]
MGKVAKPFSVNELRARELMTRQVVTASPGEPLSELLGKMKKADVYELPVVERGNLLGMVSYDVLIKRRQFPLSSEAKSVMVSAPSVPEDASAATIAEALLSSDMRAVPVVRRSRVVGIVSRSDLIRGLLGADELSSVKVEDVMSPSPVVVRERDSLERARQGMKSLDVRSVPVVDDQGRLVGVVGARDIVQVMEDQREGRHARSPGERVPLEIAVGSVMSSPAIAISPEATLAEAAKLMVERDVSTVVVTRDDRPVGVLTQSDILELLTSLKEKEGLYVNITGLEDEDPDTYDMLYSIIERAMKRVASLCSPRVLTMHIARHHTRGDVYKHSLRVRLSTRKGIYRAYTYAWDLFAATDDAMKKLEKQIRRARELDKEKPRGRKF